VVAVRMAVVASVGVLVLVGPAWVRQHVPAVVGILIAATVYAVVLLANPKFEARRTRYSWAVALADSAITLAWIAVTGGPHSPVVAVLPLVVIASAARLSFIETLLLSTLLGLAYTAVIVPSSSTPATAPTPWLQASWWALYLLFAAVLTAGLSTLAEREHRSRLRALVEAETQHAAAEEERDLRSRLLTSYQSQQDGLQVLVSDLMSRPLSFAHSPWTFHLVHGVVAAEDRRYYSHFGIDPLGLAYGDVPAILHALPAQHYLVKQNGEGGRLIREQGSAKGLTYAGA